MIHYKKAALIGYQDSIELFQFFGFAPFNLNQNPIDQIIQTIDTEIEAYAMIFIAANVELTSKQRKQLDGWNIPISILPLNETDSGVEELKRLTEKAVGMNLENLFTV